MDLYTIFNEIVQKKVKTCTPLEVFTIFAGTALIQVKTSTDKT